MFMHWNLSLLPSETVAPCSWAHQVLPALVPHKWSVLKLLSMEVMGNINLLNTNISSPLRLHKSNYDTMKECGFVTILTVVQTEEPFVTLLLYRNGFAMIVKSKLSTDGIMDMWNRVLKNRTGWSIRAGPVCECTRSVSRLGDPVEREFLWVHGSRPKAAQGYSAILTPHRLSYRPPSQPDTNRPSDLYTETTNYNKADEETKESLKGLLEIKACQSVSPQWRTLTHDKQCDGQFFKPWSESVS